MKTLILGERSPAGWVDIKDDLLHPRRCLDSISIVLLNHHRNFRRHQIFKMKSSSWSLLPITLLSAIAEAAHHVVTVGKGNQLKFDPENVPAAVGDTIEYQFFAKVSSPEIIFGLSNTLTRGYRNIQLPSQASQNHASS